MMRATRLSDYSRGVNPVNLALVAKGRDGADDRARVRARQASWYGDPDMATAVPNPSDEHDLEDLIADPEETRRSLELMDEEESRGTLVTLSHEEIGLRLGFIRQGDTEAPEHDPSDH